MPPSKEKSDPLYDDRMHRMLLAIPSAQPLDIRELLIQQQTTEAAHDADIASANSHSGWTATLSLATGFNLILPDKTGKAIDADARCFFLPFYINQDGSWLSEWDTFTGLQQYRSPTQPILEYFTGVKPPEWYEINSKKALAQRGLEEQQREQRLVSQFRERFGKSISLSGPKILPSVFEQDINRLTIEVSALNFEQEQLRDIAVREQEALNSALLQVKLARRSSWARTRKICLG
jgi:hypothetical protein